MNKPIRQMVVHDYHYEATYGSGVCPQIRIRGKYLTKAGFNPGDKIQLEVKEGKITIRKG